MGSIIPKPAWTECLRAYLLVLIGNKYGRSDAAVPVALRQITKIPEEAWMSYFDETLPSDGIVLCSLLDSKPQQNFSVLLEQLNLKNLQPESKYGKILYTAAIQGNYSVYKRFYFSTAAYNC